MAAPSNYMQLLPLELRQMVASDLRPSDANKWRHQTPYPPGAWEGRQPEYLIRVPGTPQRHWSGRTLPDTWRLGPAWRIEDVQLDDFEGKAHVADYVDPRGREWELIRPWDREADAGAMVPHHPVEGSAFWRLKERKTARQVADVCYTRSCQTKRL
jgi:hypothetical protein